VCRSFGTGEERISPQYFGPVAELVSESVEDIALYPFFFEICQI
jgi:hypothetical protein